MVLTRLRGAGINIPDLLRAMSVKVSVKDGKSATIMKIITIVIVMTMIIIMYQIS